MKSPMRTVVLGKDPATIHPISSHSGDDQIEQFGRRHRKAGSGSEARRPPLSGPEVVGKLRSVVCGRMRSSGRSPYMVNDGNLQLFVQDVPRTSLCYQLLACFSYANRPDADAPSTYKGPIASTRCLFTRTVAEPEKSCHTS